MPEGLLDELTLDQAADLLAWLSEQRSEEGAKR